MIKSEATNSKLSIGIKCGDCLHHKIGPAVFEAKCSDMGIKAFANACPSFTPNIYKVVNQKIEYIKLLGSITKDMDSTAIRVFSYIFRNIDIIQKHGFKFGQPVFFQMRDHDVKGDWLSNYFKGYVISITKDGHSIHLASSLIKGKGNSFISLPLKSILVLSKFNTLKAKFIKANRIVPPEYVKSKLKHPLFRAYAPTQLPSVYKNYIPPTLDNAPKSWTAPKHRPLSAKGIIQLMEKKAMEKSAKTKPRKKLVGGMLEVKRGKK